MEILNKPFGPFRDCDLLTETCKSVPTRVLQLEDVMLECGGAPIGLTECEPCQPEYEAKRFDIAEHGVRFRGALRIEKLDWLTASARDIIEEELRCRDTDLHINRVSRSTLTLDNLYARRYTIKVGVQGVKNMPANYLFTKLVLQGLLLTSKDRNRQYEVKSMDIHTYKLSRLYLSRYRALKVMHELIAFDEQASPESTPIPKRTPSWFANLYLTHMAYSDAARTHRLIYTSSDSDIEPGTNGQLKEGGRHTLRHVPHAEVFSLLGMHAEWILADHEKRKRKYLNGDAWARWVVEVKKTRKQAHDAHVRWGAMDDEHMTTALAGGGSGAEEDMPERHTRKKGKGKKRNQAFTSRQQSAASDSGSSTHYEASGWPINLMAEGPDQTTLRTYDSDFSPESTPPASPSASSESLPSRSSTPPNPNIWKLIPSAFMQAPLLPLDFRWSCPVERCDYDIDLQNPSDENCHALHEDDVQKLKAGGWTIRESGVRHCFYTMVSAHYEDHLDRLGVQVRRENGKFNIGWKKPQHHPAWPPRREPLETIRKAVKVEEEDAVLESE